LAACFCSAALVKITRNSQLSTWRCFQGFGAGVSHKVSRDRKSLYVFDEDAIIYDLATFKEVDRIEMPRPEYPERLLTA
jgi:hypothetical protein